MMTTSPPPIELILASASSRRAELLKQLGHSFTVRPASIQETIQKSLSPEQIVMNLAREKNLALPRQGHELIISADTLVIHEEGWIMGKPASRQEARDMLASLTDRSHYVYTGVTIRGGNLPGSEAPTSFFEKTEVRFRSLAEEEIQLYLDTEENYLDLAGAYGIQKRAAAFVRWIHGDYNNVVGLPLFQLSQHLQKRGLPLFDCCRGAE